MSRPKKATVDYFPHDCNHKTTIYILEQKFGNNGYAFWFKLLELLGLAEGHFFDCRNPGNWEFLQAKTHLDDKSCNEILNLLSKLGAIDSALWTENKIVWSQGFVNRIADVYKNRRTDVPKKPSPYKPKPQRDGVSTDQNPDGDGFGGVSTDENPNNEGYEEFSTSTSPQDGTTRDKNNTYNGEQKTPSASFYKPKPQRGGVSTNPKPTNGDFNGVSTDKNPQSKVKETKVNETKVNQKDTLSSEQKTAPSTLGFDMPPDSCVEYSGNVEHSLGGNGKDAVDDLSPTMGRSDVVVPARCVCPEVGIDVAGGGDGEHAGDNGVGGNGRIAREDIPVVVDGIVDRLDNAEHSPDYIPYNNKDLAVDYSDNGTGGEEQSSEQRKKPKKTTEQDFVLPDWIPKQEWDNYVKMRKKIRKDMTEDAMKLAVRTLNKLRQEGHDIVEVINQSIFNSWQGLFPLKGNFNNEQSGGFYGKRTSKYVGIDEKDFTAGF